MVSEDTRKKIVYLIFIGAVIYGAVSFVGRKGNSSVDLAAPTIEPVATAAVGEIAGIDSIASERYEWTRDPFAYGVVSMEGTQTEVRASRFQMAAISEANGQLMAIINGKPVSRGDKIEGWTVVRLTRTTAALELDGKEVLLEMGN